MASNLASSAMPPGLSLTVTTNRTNLPSTAKPLSIDLPSMVVSMLPPHSAITTLNKNSQYCEILLFMRNQCLWISSLFNRSQKFKNPNVRKKGYGCN